jgi:DNA gyrase subunit A
MAPNEKVLRLLPIRQFEEGKYVLMATRGGIVKKTELMAYANVRATGIIAITVDEGDLLIDARLTDGAHDVLLCTREGQAIRFPEEQARPMGRSARGVKGISLREGDRLVAMETVSPEAAEPVMLTVCERGFGKCTPLSEYPTRNRGGMGVITIKTSERNGKVVDLRFLRPEDDVILVTNHGKLIRVTARGISVVGRNTQGVTLVRLDEGESVVSLAKVSERAQGTADGLEAEDAPLPEDGGEVSGSLPPEAEPAGAPEPPKGPGGPA